MSDIKNPAARLLRLFEKLAANQSGTVTTSGLSDLLGNEPSFSDPFALVIDIRKEFADLHKAVSDVDQQTSEGIVLAKQLPKIQQCVDSMSIGRVQSPFGNALGGAFGGGGLGNGGANASVPSQEVALTWNLNDSAMTALAFMAMQMPQDSAVVRDELEDVRDRIEQLREAVLSASSLPEDVQGWLLELVRLMRDAIDRYYIRGAKGAREQFARIAGEIALSQKHWQVAEQRSSSVISVCKEILRKLNGFATSCRNVEYLTSSGFVQKLLGAESDQNLSGL